jgi:PmbA protein
MHTADPVSGDFSVGAVGRLIENGKKTQPVKGITIAGNLIELLEGIEEIGSDLRFIPSGANVGCPTLLVSQLSIGGH